MYTCWLRIKWDLAVKRNRQRLLILIRLAISTFNCRMVSNLDFTSIFSY